MNSLCHSEAQLGSSLGACGNREGTKPEQGKMLQEVTHPRMSWSYTSEAVWSWGQLNSSVFVKGLSVVLYRFRGKTG